MNRSHEERRIGAAPRWLMPSLRSYCVLVVLVLMVASSWRFLGDSDTGWHIRTGEWILQTHTVPRHDLFSYTMEGREWFAWEWLSDVLLALAHQAAGLPGVVAGAMLVLLASFAALYQLMIRRAADPLVALIVTSFGAVATMVHWLARPHLISILLMIVWYALVESYRRQRSRWIYFVPLLIALWANLHGAFVVTLPILVIYAVGEIVEFAIRGEWRGHELRRVVRTYSIVAALSVVAALATPYGVRLYGHLWRYLADRNLLAAINEFQSPNFHNIDGKIIELLLFLSAVAAVMAWREGRVIEVGLLLLLGHMTLQSERHVTIATVLLTPIIAEYWTKLLGEASTFISNHDGAVSRGWRAIRAGYRKFRAVDEHLPGVIIYPIALVFLYVAATSSWADRLLTPRFDPSKFPVGAADFVAKAPPGGHMYAFDGFGGYLIYRLYPRVKVFADGRSDLYRQGTVLDDMGKLSTLKPSWAEVLDRHNVKWMVLRRHEPLALIAEMSGKWTDSYIDQTARVMIRKDALPGK